jgi:hypothetical protein
MKRAVGSGHQGLVERVVQGDCRRCSLSPERKRAGLDAALRRTENFETLSWGLRKKCMRINMLLTHSRESTCCWWQIHGSLCPGPFLLDIASRFPRLYSPPHPAPHPHPHIKLNPNSISGPVSQSDHCTSPLPLQAVLRGR